MRDEKFIVCSIKSFVWLFASKLAGHNLYGDVHCGTGHNQLSKCVRFSCSRGASARHHRTAPEAAAGRSQKDEEDRRVLWINYSRPAICV